MKKVIFFFLTIILLKVSLPAQSAQIPLVNAHSAVLMDAATGKVLFRKNYQDIMAPASTTKIMTAILALEKLPPDRKVHISKNGATHEGTSLKLVCGEQKTVRELLYGSLLVSGNDAAVALAEAVSGSESKFARLMSEKAKQLGMTNTCFKNASGLPVIGHYSTAYDMAVLTRYALKNRNFAAIVATKYKTVSGPRPGEVRKLQNHNKLLWKYPYTTGVKTGYTVNAGGCLISSASRSGKTLIAVVLKTAAIYNDCIKLFNYGFGLK
jgi:D-alanyl-D-alanine carboxypeptidase (penicillin-binding protein 5/6)